MSVIKKKPFGGNPCHPNYTKMISVKVNDLCNAKCWFCIDNGNKKCKSTNKEKIAEEILKLKEYKSVILTGGEPLIAIDDVVYIASKIRSEKNYIVLNTNGILLTEEIVEKLNGNIDELQISIHHFDELKNSSVYGVPCSFEKIKKALTRKSFRAIINSNFSNVYDEKEKPFIVDNFVKLSKFLGCEKVRFAELKNVENKDFLSADDIIKTMPKRSRTELFTKGCYYETIIDGIKILVKRLCHLSKGKSLNESDTVSYQCGCDGGYYNSNTKKIETTFKVVYPDGSVFDRWQYLK